MYTIGQIANIIGISRDKLRYYEEKGILIPKQNDGNNYRQYDLKDIDTVLLIEFYRWLDLDFKTIEKLHKHGNIKNIEATLDKKQNEITRNLDRLNLLLERIKSLKKGCSDIGKYLNQYIIRSMEPIKILGQISDFRAYDEFEAIHENRTELEDTPIIKGIKRYISSDDNGIVSTKMLITKDISSFDDVNDGAVLRYEKCAYTIVEDGLHKNDVMEETYSKSLEWLNGNGYKHKGIAIIGMLLMANDEGIEKSYLEVYIPIE
ncbi:MAG TPA: MerR family transcriptional regulator [Clostridia bacterium]|nr:MerR family transcriptional regulator [Clostridia bacterium]